MTLVAPIADKVLDDNGKLRPSWVEFFSEIIRGDVGKTWNPTVANLTSVGTPTITGVYYQNNGFTDYAVKIVPSTSTSSTLGVTTIQLPFNATVDTAAFVVYGSTVANGIVVGASDTLFLPTWVAITTPITITGRVKN
jgi:hypothetical protein